MQTEQEFPEVNIYSDGGAEPNPGKGGFGVIMTYKEHKKEFYQGYELTTNNRMELMGVIFGLEQLKRPSMVTVYTDSKYVVDAINNGWAEKWRANNWYRTRKEKAINPDLWDKLLELISMQESVTFNWIKGHAGHTENERCDELANIALNSNNLLKDDGYKPIDATENSEQQTQFYNNSKILKEGDGCRKCNTPLIKKLTKKKPYTPNQTYYYEYYLLCPNCNTMYMVEEAKRFIDNNDSPLTQTLF